MRMKLAAILWKDLHRELRSKEAVQAGVVLVLLFFVLDLFTFTNLSNAPQAATAALWAPILYGSAALSARSLASETDRGTLDLLRGAPVPLGLHGVARMLLNALLNLLLAALTLLVAAALFAIPATPQLAVTLVLGALGLAVLGSVAGALAAQARNREILLPILLVPAAAPLLQAGVGATLRALAGEGWAGISTPILVLAGYSLAATGLALLLWPVLLEGE